MARIKYIISNAAFLLVLWFPGNSLFAQEKKFSQDFELELQLENRYFFDEGLYEGQERNFVSFSLQPQYDISWNKNKNSLHAHLFYRWDQHDERRTHFDIRELYYESVGKKWEWSIGFKKVFWGVTESIHLVDIINQTDQVEGFDGEQKLGQPMVQASWLTRSGTFDFFYMPYFRKRQFPGQPGRFRFPVDLERDDVAIDSNLDNWHPSFAIRWSNYYGPMDIGVSNFYGIGREPLFVPGQEGEIQALYPEIYQAGLDLQVTSGPVLWKFEGIYRYAEQQDFVAFSAGFEYTFGNLFGTGMDLGILTEYLYDSRDELAISNMDNDLFAGMRLAFNDTQSSDLLVGMVKDLNQKGTFYSIEANRRIGKNFKGSLEGRWFQSIQEDQFAYFFREDSYLRVGISWFFTNY